ncbi:MAG TPA: ATP-binding protein, partial [Sedimenticola thiotaurini]|nr:ATP-binding protein [Sedimenticola thiotaurini]
LQLETVAGVRVPGDRDLLFQAVANLVDNAIKYTPPGGHILLRLRRDGDHGELVVADNGPGIPEQERDRVFQRFYRLEQSRTTEGSGLGLSLVQAVAAIHGIGIELQDNHPGLRVVLQLPLDRARPSNPPPSTDSANRSAPPAA